MFNSMKTEIEEFNSLVVRNEEEERGTESAHQKIYKRGIKRGGGRDK